MQPLHYCTQMHRLQIKPYTKLLFQYHKQHYHEYCHDSCYYLCHLNAIETYIWLKTHDGRMLKITMGECWASETILLNTFLDFFLFILINVLLVQPKTSNIISKSWCLDISCTYLTDVCFDFTGFYCVVFKHMHFSILKGIVILVARISQSKNEMIIFDLKSPSPHANVIMRMGDKLTSTSFWIQLPFAFNLCCRLMTIMIMTMIVYQSAKFTLKPNLVRTVYIAKTTSFDENSSQ